MAEIVDTRGHGWRIRIPGQPRELGSTAPHIESLINDSHQSDRVRVRYGFTTRERVISLLTTFVAFAGTARAQSPRVLASTGADRPLSIQLTRRFSLGGEADSQLVLSKLLPQQIATDGRGNLYIGIASDGRVAVYDRGGHLARSRGRKGAGPGEIGYVGAVAADPGGSVWVVDYSKRALVGFAPDGTPLPQRPLPPRQLASGVHALGAGELLLASAVRGPVDTLVLVFADSAGDRRLMQVAQPARLPFDATKCGLLGHFELPVFTPRLRWGAHGDTVAFARDAGFRIEVFQGTRPLAVLTRNRQPTKATVALAERSMPEGWHVNVGNGPLCSIPTADLVRQVGVAPAIPAYQSLLVSPDGAIWAIRTTFPDEPTMVDLFSMRRGYEGTFNIGHQTPAAFLADGAVVMIGADDADVPLVTVYDALINPRH